MVGIGHVVMHMSQRLMPMPMAVFADWHGVVHMVVVAIVVPVRMFVFHPFVFMLVAMGLGKMKQHAGQHQHTAHGHHRAA